MSCYKMVHKRARIKLIKILVAIVVICFLAPAMVYKTFIADEEDAWTAPPGDVIEKQLRDINAYHYTKERTDEEAGRVNYDKNIPLIWIGGVPRSGTTLARAMLDAHADIRCGEETRVIPRMLAMHGQMLKSGLERERLGAAKISEDLINTALGAYMLSIIVGHGEPAKRLCNKDPFTLKSIPRLLRIFPNSKFILMIRDGRATVNSIVKRKVTIRGFDHTSYSGGLRDWNKAIVNMYNSCKNEGPSRCLPVYYEQLVLHPKTEMKKILDFLDVEWDESVLHHENAIGKAGGISLSERELSTDQVDKPVNILALTKWVADFPEEVKSEVNNIAPMIKQLGYDTKNYPPFYGYPDKEVIEKSRDLQQQQRHLANRQQS